ncbi:MAG: YfhO family protein [Vicinamibacteria bacterium]|nr:YfhO family protein [Vicinamibacteria bacterium]
MNAERRREAGWAAAGLLPALAALEGVLRGGALFERDVHLSWHAHAWAFKRALAAGELPLWDPLWGFGQPHWANPQTQSAYPTTWLLLVLEPWAAYSAIVGLHVAWAALGAHALARRLGLAPPFAALAGALFSASGPLLSMGSLWHQLCGAAWLPWIAWAGLRALHAPGPASAALWGLTLAFQVLAGSGEMALGGAALSAALAVTGLLRAGPRPARLATAAGAALLGLSLSALVWWPALDVAARSAREQLDRPARTYWSVRPGALLQLFLPVPVDTLPRPADDSLAAREDAEPFLPSLYLGLPALGLLAAATASARRRTAAAVAVATLLLLALALGRHAPVHSAAETLLPPLQALRFPVKAMPAATLGFALLAALGAEACATAGGAEARRRALVALAPALAVAVALALAPLPAAPFARPFPSPRAAAWAPLLALVGALALGGFASRRRAATGTLVLGLCAVSELASAHRGLNPLAPPDLLRFRPPTLESLSATDRIHVWDYRARPAGKRYPERDLRGFFLETPRGLPPAFARALGLQHYLYPSIGPRHGLAGSFSHDLMRLYPLPLRDLVQLQRDSAETPGYLRLLQLGSVDAVLALHGGGHPGLEQRAVLPGGFAEPIHVFAVPGTLPRARGAGGALVADGWDAYRALLDPGHDLAAVVVLAAGPARPVPPGFAADVRETARGSNHVELQVEFSHDGWVVLADAWDPGWQADVDGRPQPVLRANVAFRAVAVPSGRHVVRLAYHPGALRRGAALAAAGALALAAALALGFRPGRPRPAS